MYSIKNFRLKVDMHIINHQDQVMHIARVLSFVISLITIVSIIVYHGFYISKNMVDVISQIIRFSLYFYIAKYFLQLFYSLKWGNYIKKTRFEFIIIALLILHFIPVSFLPESDNVETIRQYYLLFIQFYFLIIVSIELTRGNNILLKLNLPPPKLMMFSFLLLISLGTLLLMLPRMTTYPISFIDALFTATSASCITGLTVLDVGQTFTLKGQIIILALIQLGGMSILTFATFFTVLFSKSNAGLRYQHLVKDILSTNKLSDSYFLLKNIGIATIIIEVLGSGLLYIYWTNSGAFASHSETLFHSVFHAVSAFNNAGITLWGNNMMHENFLAGYFPQTIIMVLVIIGGLGFMTLSDLFDPRNIKERRKYRWKKLLPGTKIVLITTTFIAIIGTVLFLLVESEYSLLLQGSFFDKLFASFFQITTARTAGFNTLNVAYISVPGMLLLMLGMFIGASPGSTGGGIKTTTFYVIIKSVIATIRGKKHIEFEKKFIPFEIVDKAYSIVIMSLMMIFASTFVLSIIEPEFDLLTHLFESVSAFSTTGLSTGKISQYAWDGKLILILNMYIGRIGTLTLAYALSRRIKESMHQYPETYFMVG